MSDKIKHTNEQLAIQNLMRTENGRSLIYGWLQSFGIFESIFNENPVKAGYNSGRRDAGLEIEGAVKSAAPGDYLKMIDSNINR